MVLKMMTVFVWHVFVHTYVLRAALKILSRIKRMVIFFLMLYFLFGKERLSRFLHNVGKCELLSLKNTIETAKRNTEKLEKICQPELCANNSFSRIGNPTLPNFSSSYSSRSCLSPALKSMFMALILPELDPYKKAYITNFQSVAKALS